MWILRHLCQTFVGCHLFAVRLLGAPLGRPRQNSPSGAWSVLSLSKKLPPHFIRFSLFFDQANPDLRTSDPSAFLAAAKKGRFARDRPLRFPHAEAEKAAARQIRAGKYCEDFLSFCSTIDNKIPSDDLSLCRI